MWACLILLFRTLYVGEGLYFSSGSRRRQFHFCNTQGGGGGGGKNNGRFRAVCFVFLALFRVACYISFSPSPHLLYIPAAKEGGMKGFVFGGLHDALLWKEGIFGISEEEEAVESAISQTKFEILRRGWCISLPRKFRLAASRHFPYTLSIRNKRKKTSITDPQQDEIFHLLLLLDPSFFALHPAVNRAQQTHDTREVSSVGPKSFSRYIQERGEEGFAENAGFTSICQGKWRLQCDIFWHLKCQSLWIPPSWIPYNSRTQSHTPKAFGPASLLPKEVGPPPPPQNERDCPCCWATKSSSLLLRLPLPIKKRTSQASSSIFCACVDVSLFSSLEIRQQHRMIPSCSDDDREKGGFSFFAYVLFQKYALTQIPNF